METTNNQLAFMKLGLCTLALCVICAFPLSAQKNSFCDRLFFGGGFCLTVCDYTDIEVSPIVGYYVTSRWAVGVGFTYEYYNSKYHR